MNSEERRDSITDPVLLAAITELRNDVPHDVDWGRLRRNINDQAALSLARRRKRGSSVVRQPFAQLALAASVAFALWAGPTIYSEVFGPEPVSEYAAQIDHDQILEQALGSDLTEHEFRLLVTGRANPEVLLAVAVGTP